MLCQCVISRRRVGREAGQEWVAYDVMRPKALRKRDEVAGVEAEAEDRRESEAEGVPLTITPPLDEHRLDAEESERLGRGCVVGLPGSWCGIPLPSLGHG